MRSLFQIFFLTILVLSACQPSGDNGSGKPWDQYLGNVEIIRDDFGVPHIYGKTDADAVFGLLYAQCEDDFRRVERNFTWALGRLAEEKGKEALYSDLRAKLFMTEDEAKEYYSSAPNWMKKLCEAWAAGINYYLFTHEKVMPTVIKTYEPWMTMYFTEGSIGGDIERVSERKIRAFYGSETEMKTAAMVDSNDLFDEPKGSNGFAISGDRTATGNTLLLINPHTSFYFRGEVHVVSDEGLNAYGAVTWGQFFVYQGFNENTGWMHTSTGTDIIDEFHETIIERGDELYYQYGAEERKVEKVEQKLRYLEDDTLKEKTFTIYRTHHGPITHIDDGKWTSTALMWDPVNALTQSYTRTKKKNLAEFHKMMNIRTNSSNNTVFADSEGNIAYYHGNFIPKRDIQFDYLRPVDGSNPATDWQGLHELEETIIVKNPANGWIQNCNSTPFTSAGIYSPKKEDYPYYMTSFPENFRGMNALRLLEKTDSITIDGLIQLGYDTYLPAFEKVIPSLIEAYDGTKEKSNLNEAIEILRKWDFRTDISSVGMTLAHFYGMNLYRLAKSPSGLSAMERFDFYAKNLSREEQLHIFSQTLEELKEKFVNPLMEWGEVNRFQRLSGAIDASFDDSKPSIPVALTTARWGHLAAYGMRGGHNVNKIYGTRGNSFVAVVEFGPKVKAKTILAGGQSSDPNSPHFNDQAAMYARGEFKEVAFYREEVEARAEERYRPGEKK